MTTEINDSKNILLIMERDNARKDNVLINFLRDSCRDIDYQMVFYGSHGESTSYILDPQGRLDVLPTWVRKPLKAVLLLKYPSRWGYFLGKEIKIPEESIETRCRNLRQYIQDLGQDKNIVILSRSAGGRISSLIADELRIKKLICLGYPFKHPEKPPEPERYKHLAHINTPFLILQGANDKYGGSEIKSRYKLSGHVFLRFVDTDHDFKLSKEAWGMIIKRIKDFIL